MKKTKYGHWLYKVYDAKTHELLAKGSSKEVGQIMNWSDDYAIRKVNMKYKPRYEIVTRKWVETIYHIHDLVTHEDFMGNFDDCASQIKKWVGKELTDKTIYKYMINDSKRFEVERWGSLDLDDYVLTDGGDYV